MVSSKALPTLERKPGGPDNWVEKAGGLPEYISGIAKHLVSERGMSVSKAIATAVSRCKVWAAGGGGASPATQAKAAKAIAQWEAKKSKSKATKDMTDVEFAQVIELVFAAATKTSVFNEAKVARSPLNGQFGQKFSASQLLAARRAIEGDVVNLQVGEQFKLPGDTGWVQRDEAGYVVQGPAGVRIVSKTVSEAIQAAAMIVAGEVAKLGEGTNKAL